MRKIGIVGSRRRDGIKDFNDVGEKLNEIYKDGDIIVSGGCPKGADRFAEKLAKHFGIPILIYYPDYKRYGRGATFVRNKQIADASDFLIACVAEDRKGGTEDTIKKFRKKLTEEEAVEKGILNLV
jgi:hypothetical protein